MEIKAVAAVVRGTPLKRTRLSALKISNGLRYWYSRYKQLPKGVSVFAPSVKEWATRNGVALRKLATCSWLILWRLLMLGSCKKLLKDGPSYMSVGLYRGPHGSFSALSCRL